MGWTEWDDGMVGRAAQSPPIPHSKWRAGSVSAKRQSSAFPPQVMILDQFHQVQVGMTRMGAEVQ